MKRERSASELRAVGARVLAALDRGRAKAIAQARARGARTLALVADLAHADLLAGRSARGRPGRIARRLRGAVSERRVREILAALYSVSDSVAQNQDRITCAPPGECGDEYLCEQRDEARRGKTESSE